MYFIENVSRNALQWPPMNTEVKKYKTCQQFLPQRGKNRGDGSDIVDLFQYSAYAETALQKRWITWVGRDSQSPFESNGYTQNYLKIKPYVWERCTNTSAGFVPWALPWGAYPSVHIGEHSIWVSCRKKKNKPLIWQIWALRNKSPAKLHTYWLSIARVGKYQNIRTFSQMTWRKVELRGFKTTYIYTYMCV